MLEPLLHDLHVLEEQSMFVSVIGEFVKGSVQCVITDNLAAHGFKRSVFLLVLSRFAQKSFMQNMLGVQGKPPHIALE